MGAYFSGSTVGKPDEAEMAPSSDIDIVVVTQDAEPLLSWENLSTRML